MFEVGCSVLPWFYSRKVLHAVFVIFFSFTIFKSDFHNGFRVKKNVSVSQKVFIVVGASFFPNTLTLIFVFGSASEIVFALWSVSQWCPYSHVNRRLSRVIVNTFLQ